MGKRYTQKWCKYVHSGVKPPHSQQIKEKITSPKYWCAKIIINPKYYNLPETEYPIQDEHGSIKYKQCEQDTKGWYFENSRHITQKCVCFAYFRASLRKMPRKTTNRDSWHLLTMSRMHPDQFTKSPELWIRMFPFNTKVGLKPQATHCLSTSCLRTWFWKEKRINVACFQLVLHWTNLIR